jgi:RNA polymerase sigma-70 factor (ECF subfamily)
MEGDGTGREPARSDTFALLRRYRDAGDREALNRVFAAHYPRVERIVRIRLGVPGRGRPELDDVLQETMLRAFEKLDQFECREEARLVHWLAVIAHRRLSELLRHARAQKREAGREVDLGALRSGPDGEDRGLELPSDSTAVFELVERTEMEELVDRCLARLPEHYRDVILFREYEGGSWAQVAEWMERSSEDAVRHLHERARALLSDCVRRGS